MAARTSHRRDTDAIVQRMGRVRLFAVFMQPTRDYDVETGRGRELMLDHLDWLLDLEDEGRLFAGGPINYDAPERIRSQDPVINATGVFIFAAGSLREAERIAAREPFFKAGWRTYTVCSWLLNEGRAIPVGRQVSEDFEAGDPTLGTASWERTERPAEGD